jgi:ribosomal protein S27AE
MSPPTSCPRCGRGILVQGRWAPYCRRVCFQLARAEAKPPACFTGTIRPGTTRCPRCGDLLAEEGGFLHCRYGCGRIWLIDGASIAAQIEYERHAGVQGAA